MSDPPRAETTPASSASTPEFVATLASLVVVIVALLFADEFLARVDRNESLAHAANLYADARAALAARDARAARDRFQAAVALDRNNVLFQVGLAEAMVAQGHLTEAERRLRAVLDRAETDGAANLLLARVLLREGRSGEAKSYFHRAIYGHWGGDSLAQRRAARLELIALLDRSGAREELLAELLPIQDAPRSDVAFRRSLGTLFLRANSPTRSVEVLEGVLRETPDDADARFVLGQAELVLGDFRSARSNLAQVAQARRGDSAVAAALRLADTALAIDPTTRGIGSRLRRSRSRLLLTHTATVVHTCTSAPARAAALADSVLQPVVPRRGQVVEEPESDTILDVASELWLGLPARCRGGSATDRAVALIQEKLAR